MNTRTNVSIGPSSIIGWGVGAVALLYSAATAFTASEAQLHGPGKWAAILGVASTVATNAGRQLQARGVVVHVPAGVTDVLDELPTLAQELASPPPPAG